MREYLLAKAQWNDKGELAMLLRPTLSSVVINT